MKQAAQILMGKHLHELGLSYQEEVRFDPKRKWRFDFLLFKDNPNGVNVSGLRVAIEIEGGIWSKGRHVRGKGFQDDLEKYNEATMAGYRVLRFSTEDVLEGRAKEFVKRWIG